MSETNAFHRVRDILDDKSRGAWVFGVCLAIQKRSSCSLWACRASTLVSLIFFTLPTLIGYIILGLLLDETRDETRLQLGKWWGILEKVVQLISKKLSGSPATG